MRIVTNNKPRPIIYWHDLSEKEKQEFDYISEDDVNCSSFFRYKNWVFTLSDFMRDGTPDGWDGAMGQSYFDAILVKIVDSETVIVGRAVW